MHSALCSHYIVIKLPAVTLLKAKHVVKTEVQQCKIVERIC